MAVLTGCSTIDEDMSDCGFEVDYELNMVTTIQTKLQTQLQTDLELQTNLELTASLNTYLGTIFRDHADDVELSFYDVNGDSVLLEHDQHDMNGKEESYTLNIPRRHYLHLATANVKQEQSVETFDQTRCHSARLEQIDLDTIPSHTTGLFSARYDMDIKDSVAELYRISQPPELFTRTNTTIGAIVTNGNFDKAELTMIAGQTRNAYARAIKPVGTLADGDTVYASSCGKPVQADVNMAGTLAAEVMAKAIEKAIIASRMEDKEYLSHCPELPAKDK